jgi:hypothetical protein
MSGHLRTPIRSLMASCRLCRRNKCGCCHRIPQAKLRPPSSAAVGAEISSYRPNGLVDANCAATYIPATCNYLHGVTVKKSYLVSLLATVVIGLSSLSVHSATIFEDNFDDGDVSDWSIVTNFPGVSSVTVRSDSFVSPSFALWTYFDAPPGGTNLFVTAEHTFSAPTAGSYSIALDARSTACDICTISYEVYLDGGLLGSNSAPDAFESFLATPVLLTSGTHTIGLGVRSNFASSGRFNASFDNVVISSIAPVPEPEAYALMLAGLATLGALANRRRVVKTPG